MTNNSFETFNQLIDVIKSVASGVDAYSTADKAKDLAARELAADALRHRIAQLTKLAAVIDVGFGPQLKELANLESDISPKSIFQINEKIEPLRKALLSEILRLSIDS